jgi:hypothetical protein
MTAHTRESVPTHLATRSILATGKSMPPRDPNDNDDEEEEEEEEDGEAESDEDEPAIIREPDE